MSVNGCVPCRDNGLVSRSDEILLFWEGFGCIGILIDFGFWDFIYVGLAKLNINNRGK
jgi:hypothetical protein